MSRRADERRDRDAELDELGSDPGQVGPESGGQSGDVGFGCESADVLHVVKRGENEIMFPGCADFPYPLIRCSSR